jgi:hypothetical protein
MAERLKCILKLKLTFRPFRAWFFRNPISHGCVSLRHVLIHFGALPLASQKKKVFLLISYVRVPKERNVKAQGLPCGL